jgi:hypothetical protein
MFNMESSSTLNLVQLGVSPIEFKYNSYPKSCGIIAYLGGTPVHKDCSLIEFRLIFCLENMGLRPRCTPVDYEVDYPCKSFPEYRDKDPAYPLSQSPHGRLGNPEKIWF